MKMNEKRNLYTLSEEDITKILEECRAALAKGRISEDGTTDFLETVNAVLHDYQQFFSDAQEVRCRLRKKLGRIEFGILVRGEKRNPLEESELKDSQLISTHIRSLNNDQSIYAAYRYFQGFNIITVYSPPPEDSRNILKQPMVLAMILGIIAGFIAQNLPAPVTSFLINDLASPILSIVLKCTAGVMAPVVFLSLIISISSLDDINELNSWGIKIFLRFLNIALFLTLVAMGVSIIVFPILGVGSSSFEPRVIIDLILNIIPVNFISPFLDGNVQQIVVLALGLGAALLIIGERLKGLIPILRELRDWLNELMRIVRKIMPLVPFISVFNLIAGRQTDALLSGWKYILAIYFCFIVCFALKFLKVSIRCHIPIAELFGKIKPLALSAFSVGSETSTMHQMQETAEQVFHVDEKFSSFWVPLNQALLAPPPSIQYILAPFFAAMLAGTPASLNFLMILLVLGIQLSLASPGLTPGWTLLFQALGLPAEYVGLFSAYNVFVKNFGAAFGISYRILEVIEASQVIGSDVSDMKADHA